MPWPGASSRWAAHCSECPVGLFAQGAAIRIVWSLPGAENHLRVREELGASAGEVQPQHHLVCLGLPAPLGEHLPPVPHVRGPDVSMGQSPRLNSSCLGSCCHSPEQGWEPRCHSRALCPVPVPGAQCPPAACLADTIPPCCHCRAVIYFNFQMVRGRQRLICLLREQIANVCEHCPCPSPLPHSLLQPQDCQSRLWPQQCHPSAAHCAVSGVAGGGRQGISHAEASVHFRAETQTFLSAGEAAWRAVGRGCQGTQSSAMCPLPVPRDA